MFSLCWIRTEASVRKATEYLMKRSKAHLIFPPRFPSMLEIIAQISSNSEKFCVPFNVPRNITSTLRRNTKYLFDSPFVGLQIAV